jgi:hypothetical protein
MRNATYYGTTIVAVHAAATLLHAIPHMAIPVPTTPAQNAFIAIVINLAPLVAATLLWTRFGRTGAWLLLASMAGSLAFGLYYHFIVEGPDHVSRVPADGWGTLFLASSVLLSVTEGLGCWIGVWALKAMPRATGRPRALETA